MSLEVVTIGNATLYRADCRDVLKTLPDNSIESIVTDPPYGLSFMGKKWDYDVPSVEVWAECLRVLKPGGHLLAFAGTRTQHRMCVRIEDAGFEIRDMIAWVYGSGFPKSLDVSKAIDKAAGAEREVVGDKTFADGSKARKTQKLGGNATFSDEVSRESNLVLTAPATEAARQWQGWGTALKPALETVTFASKPFSDEQERGIILSNLIQLEARLWLLSSVSAAEKSSTSSRSEFDAACVIAQWSADEITSTRAALCDPMGTSLFELATTTSLNIVSSWRRTLVESWNDGNTSTTETKSSTTTDWRTLKFSLSQITPNTIIRACSLPGGFSVNASTAESYFNASLSLLQSIRTLSATERAISLEAESCRDVGVKPNLDPCIMARKPLGTCATNVLQMVESQLRERGVRGEILWKPENASGATRSKKTTSSGSTRPLEASETFAKNADESVTRSVEQQSLKSSEKHGTSGINPTLGGSESFHGFTTSGCENPLSPPTAGSAPAAESVSVISSPSTTSTAEEHSTENEFTGRSTHNCAEKDSRLDTASFAGIATGLTGSMGTVRISRDSEGFFLWPKGLPEFVPGSPLTVAANVMKHGTGAINIDGCRINPGELVPGGGNGKANNGGRFGAHDTFGVRAVVEPHTSGRWPANLIHDGSDEVLVSFPDSNGSAARFFYCAKASKKDRDDGLDHLPEMKSSVGDNRPGGDFNERLGKTPGVRRNHHPTVKPIDLMRYLVRLVTPPGGMVLDPFMGSGSTGKAAMLDGFRFIGIEREPKYFDIACERIYNAYRQNTLFGQDENVQEVPASQAAIEFQQE